ncbi:MAG: prepilin-type N-terminal cleavage/methylation domain-containing protein [Tenericutes bacterium]|nr:prepilin-type N-terminal cleavage/methylation domain-containing protein [Mycoplasmatota bacterium]
MLLIKKQKRIIIFINYRRRKTMFKTLRNEKGLTLIELIAVLVILGIIAAIAIPTIGNTISTQRERAADAEWSAIMSAARLYSAQNSTVTEFSMDDLFAANNISENVVLSEDAAGAVIASSEDIFVVSSGVVSINETIPVDGDIYIEVFMVYDGA